MLKIGILSDTHGFLNPKLFTFFKDCDEIWHAGDWGSEEVLLQLKQFKPLKSVYGNIDGREVRQHTEEVNYFMAENLQVCMIHIGGYPGKYSAKAASCLKEKKIDIMVCGHSHILKVMRDPTNQLMFFNPGAAGRSGFHTKSTALRLKLDGKRMFDLEVWEQPRSEL